MSDQGGGAAEDAPENWRWRAAPLRGDVVVFDLDGVLSDAAGRQHFLDDPDRKDWQAFFDACGDDPLVDEIDRLLRLLDEDLRIVLLTARPARVMAQTVAWLDRYRIRWNLLVMRPDRDFRPTTGFKRDSVRQLRRAGMTPLLAFEDDRRNVAMFREEGIACVYIHSGYYE